jgi:hypothetical protein
MSTDQLACSVPESQGSESCLYEQSFKRPIERRQETNGEILMCWIRGQKGRDSLFAHLVNRGLRDGIGIRL